MTQYQIPTDPYVSAWPSLQAVTPEPARALPSTTRTSRFHTVLAIHRGEVYVPSSVFPEGGWLVRATGSVPDAVSR